MSSLLEPSALLPSLILSEGPTSAVLRLLYIVNEHGLSVLTRVGAEGMRGGGTREEGGTRREQGVAKGES
jgi:hypothetical protein